jgi:hypothetical protein
MPHQIKNPKSPEYVDENGNPTGKSLIGLEYDDEWYEEMRGVLPPELFGGVSEKHLPGQHRQLSHGNRAGSNSSSSDFIEKTKKKLGLTTKVSVVDRVDTSMDGHDNSDGRILGRYDPQNNSAQVARVEGKKAKFGEVKTVDEINYAAMESTSVMGTDAIVAHELGHGAYRKNNIGSDRKWRELYKEYSKLMGTHEFVNGKMTSVPANYEKVISRYSLHNDEELYAESMVVFMFDPNWLQSNQPELYDYLSTSYSEKSETSDESEDEGIEYTDGEKYWWVKKSSKHLPGQHAQKRHGWRYGGGMEQPDRAFANPSERAEYMRRFGNKSKVRGKYRAASSKVKELRGKYAAAKEENRKTSIVMEKAWARYERTIELYEAAAANYSGDNGAAQNAWKKAKAMYTLEIDDRLNQINQDVEDRKITYYEGEALKREVLSPIKAQERKARETEEKWRNIMNKRNERMKGAREKNNEAHDKNIEAQGGLIEARNAYLNNGAFDIALENGMVMAEEQRRKLLRTNNRMTPEKKKAIQLELHAQQEVVRGKMAALRKKHEDAGTSNYDDPEYERIVFEGVKSRFEAEAKLATSPAERRAILKSLKAEEALSNRAFELLEQKKGAHTDPEYARLTDNLLEAQSDVVVARERNKRKAQAIIRQKPAEMNLRTFEAPEGTYAANAAKDGLQNFKELAGPNPLLNNPRISIGFINDVDESIGRISKGNLYDGRAYVSGDKHIFLTEYSSKSTVVHELGHVLEGVDYRIEKAAVDFLKRRIAGYEQTEKLSEVTGNSAYKNSEVTVADNFMHPYMGKIYPGFKSTEIMSMGMQLFFDDPVKFARDDPDMFRFIYAVVRVGNEV